MERKDFKNLLSEAFGRYDKKSRKFLKESFEKNNKKIDRKLELQAKRIKKDIRGEFGRFVDVAIVPQFDKIYTELREIKDWVNDLSHLQDRMLKISEKHGEILGKHGDQLERIEAKL